MKKCKIIIAVLLTLGLLLSFPLGVVGNNNPTFIVPVTRLTSVPAGFTAIRTAQELNNIRNNLSGSFILMNDIDLTAWGNWVPIDGAFTGVLNGNGHVIRNMTINQTIPNASGLFLVGLFARMNGSVQNLGIEGGSITVDASSPNPVHVGVIAGEMFNGHGVINSYSTVPVHVSVNLSNEVTVGGLVGRAAGNSGAGFENSFNEGNIIVNATNPSFWLSSVHVGGIAGTSSQPIRRSFNTGNVTATGYRNVIAGGLVGESFFGRVIENCFNQGIIEAIAQEGTADAGGIAGANAVISNTYNTGAVTASSQLGTANAGAITGLLTASITNSYFLNAMSNSVGSNDSGTLNNVRALSNAQMQQQASFVGFDFTNVWEMPTGGGFPVLRRNITAPTSHTVIFHANGGTVTPASISVTNGGTFGSLPTPTRSGHTFAGWFTATTGGTRVWPTDTVNLTSNIMLYARWTANSYTVTLNANGGSVSPTSITVTIGGTFNALPTPRRSGHTFNGWFTAATGGTRVRPTDVVSLTGNITLFARWTANSTTPPPSDDTIFSTGWPATVWNWIMFFLLFGWVWMWF